MMTTKQQVHLPIRALRNRQLDLLEAVHEIGFATLRQITTLRPSDPLLFQKQHKKNPMNKQWRQGSEYTRKLLRQLKNHEFIYKIGFPERLAHEEAIYHITKQGCLALIKRRGFDKDKTHQKLNTYKRSHLQHEVEVANFYAALRRGLQLHATADWDYQDEAKTRPCWIYPTSSNGGAFKVTINADRIPKIAQSILNTQAQEIEIVRVPDGLGRLKPFAKLLDHEHHQHTILCLYEKDRGTEDYPRLAAKLLCYREWRLQRQRIKAEKIQALKDQSRAGQLSSAQYNEQVKQVIETYGQHLRVLVEVENEQSLRSMIERSALYKDNETGTYGSKGSGILWFTVKQNWLENPQNLFAKIWVIGHLNHFKSAKKKTETWADWFVKQEKHSLLEFLPSPAQPSSQEDTTLSAGVISRL